jgi:hypothetical protein
MLSLPVASLATGSRIRPRRLVVESAADVGAAPLGFVLSAHHIFPMCGRYASFLPAEFIVRLFATVDPLPNLAPTWNMAPTMDAPVVRLVDGARHLDALKWGLALLWQIVRDGITFGIELTR